MDIFVYCEVVLGVIDCVVVCMNNGKVVACIECRIQVCTSVSGLPQIPKWNTIRFVEWWVGELSDLGT